MGKSKIICISGSHREGCTEYILNQISDKLNAELILDKSLQNTLIF
jgi:hypothetical protein